MNYAGFWRRFGALWLDLIIMIPLIALGWWGNQHVRLFDLYYFIPGTIFRLFYHVYLVRRFGGTPGKLMLGASIRKTDGSPVGYREALLRYLPNALWGVLTSIGSIYARLSLTDAAYVSLSFMERSKQIAVLAPAWYRPANFAFLIWALGDGIVMLANHKRRTLHDFIAGTIVLSTRPAIASRDQEHGIPTQHGDLPADTGA